MRGPSGGVGFAHSTQLTGLEGLKQHGRIAKELDLDLVKVMGATTKRNIAAPIVSIAGQGQGATGDIIRDAVRGRAYRDISQRRIGEIFGLPSGLLQDRAQSGQQGQLSVGFIKGDTH